jgi:hypothetical protein
MEPSIQVAKAFLRDGYIEFERIPGDLEGYRAEFFVKDNVLKHVERARKSLDESNALGKREVLFEVLLFEGRVYTDLAGRQPLHEKRRKFARSAIESLKSALALNATQEVHYCLGMAYSILHDSSEAQASFELAVQMDPASKWGIEAAKAKQIESETKRFSFFDLITGIFSGNL